MAKIFVRTFDPRRGFHDGQKLPGAQMLSCGENWLAFQQLLIECLGELGHQVIEQPADPAVPDRADDATVRIYAHRTSRDVAGQLYYKQMHLCPLFTIDSSGWGADHNAFQKEPHFEHVAADRARDFCVALSRQQIESGTSKHPQPERRVPDALPARYFFVPMQRPRDYVQIHHGRVSVVDFVGIVSRWSTKTKEHVVIKLHPGNSADPEVVQAVRDADERHEFVHCHDGNVNDLIMRSAGVITINSGVGFESLIHGKPVVTLGDCDYRWVTFQADEKSLPEALPYALEYSAQQRGRAWQFVYSYCFEVGYYLTPEETPQCKVRLLRYLEDTLSPLVN